MDLNHLDTVKTALRTAREEELSLKWLRHGNRQDPRVTPWMPFQLADFTAIVAECLPDVEGIVFLDIGCGIGTKMLVASKVFGFLSAGIEIDPVMAKESEARGYFTAVEDALTGVNSEHLIKAADFIWLYRPFRDQFEQAKLEHRVFTLCKSGAVVAGGAWENQPNGWEMLIDDWDNGHRGAWKKPLSFEPVTYDIDGDE